MLPSTRHGKGLPGLHPCREAARAACLAIVMVSVASCASMRYGSTFNVSVPTVTVEVEHPPDVGFVVDEVAFAGGARSGRGSETPEARCEAEWMQALTEWLVESGVRVVRGTPPDRTPTRRSPSP